MVVYVLLYRWGTGAGFPLVIVVNLFVGRYLHKVFRLVERPRIPLVETAPHRVFILPHLTVKPLCGGFQH